MSKKKLTVILAVLIALCAFFFVLRVSGIADVHLLLPGWWALFLIVPGVLALIDRLGRVLPVLSIVLGTLFFLGANHWIPLSAVVGLALPLGLLSVGGVLWWESKHPGGKKREALTDKARRREKLAALPQYAAGFGNVTAVPREEVFSGASITACFGELTLDLREKRLAQGTELVVFAAFGRVRVLLPENVDVILRVTPLVARVKDGREKGGVPLAGAEITGLALFSEVTL